MHTPSPQHTPPQHPTGGPGGSGGGGSALLIGGIAFALVFLLIVGATVGYLLLRGPGGGGDPSAGATTSASSSASPRPELTDSGTPSSAETTTSAAPVTEERCWDTDRGHTSSNPSSRLRGGGLEFIPPAAYTSRSEMTYGAFMADTQTAYGVIEGTWVSLVAVGAVEWQPGVEYPGDEAASIRMVDCIVADGLIWGDTSQRTVENKVTEPVTIAGMPGYRTRAELHFGQHNLETFSATEIVVVVLTTPEGPSFFHSDTAIGVTEHEEATASAYESLTGLSG